MVGRTRVWRTALACLTVCAAASAAGAHDAAAPPSSPGMRAYVDPQTGRLTQEPPTGVPAPPRTTAPRPRLAEVPAPGGGMMIQLDGRFMSDLVATVQPDGSVAIDCVQRGAATGPAPE